MRASSTMPQRFILLLSQGLAWVRAAAASLPENQSSVRPRGCSSARLVSSEVTWDVLLHTIVHPFLVFCPTHLASGLHKLSGRSTLLNKGQTETAISQA